MDCRLIESFRMRASCYVLFSNGCLCLTALISRNKAMMFRKGHFRNDLRSKLAWAWETMKINGTLQVRKEVAQRDYEQSFQNHKWHKM